VVTEDGIEGTIEGSFGKSGKFRVAFSRSLAEAPRSSNAISLTFKRYIFDSNKHRMVQ
jgi:selenocysteine-specific elongation factor